MPLIPTNVVGKKIRVTSKGIIPWQRTVPDDKEDIVYEYICG